MRPTTGRGLCAGLCLGLGALGASVASVASIASACEIRVLQGRTGVLLARVAMGSARQFDLRYLHSVTRTPVRETLAVDASGLTQQRIEFYEPGPGLPTEALPGERFVRLPDRFVYEHMQRPLGALRMRVDPAQRQVLQVGAVVEPLTRWGRQSLELQPHGCH